jgi:hypothetical protein
MLNHAKGEIFSSPPLTLWIGDSGVHYEIRYGELTLIRMTKDEKGLAFFKGLLPYCMHAYCMLIACLNFKKIKKISNPPLGSYLVNEPNFWLIK